MAALPRWAPRPKLPSSFCRLASHCSPWSMARCAAGLIISAAVFSGSAVCAAAGAARSEQAGSRSKLQSATKAICCIASASPSNVHRSASHMVHPTPSHGLPVGLIFRQAAEIVFDLQLVLRQEVLAGQLEHLLAIALSAIPAGTTRSSAARAFARRLGANLLGRADLRIAFLGGRRRTSRRPVPGFAPASCRHCPWACGRWNSCRRRIPISSPARSISPGRRRSAAARVASPRRNRAGRAAAGPRASPRRLAGAGPSACLPFGPRGQVPFEASSASRRRPGSCRRAWPDRPAVRDRSHRPPWNSSCRGADRRSRAAGGGEGERTGQKRKELQIAN